MAPPVFRFAPSPNGRLHLGHAYSALLNEKMARESGGRLLLRLEDIDITRCTSALVQHCIEDLAWLGIAFEPEIRRQSEHMDDYRAALGRLHAMGLIYPCRCTRSDLARLHGHDTDPEGQPLYDGHCFRHPPTSGPFAYRLTIQKAVAQAGKYEAATHWGDVILARKDIGTSYHLSVVVDDALQGVSHVVRGTDLEQATSIHLLLQHLLGLPHPAYTHHRLITHETGRKLSKSAADKSLAALREEGVTAADIRRSLGF